MESGGGPAFSAELTRVSVRRYVAHFVDGVLYALLFVFLILAVSETSDLVLTVTLIFGLTVLHVAYFVVLQMRKGRTPGKALVGIRVVDANGDVPSTGALIKRSIPLLIEYLYVIALVGMLTSEYRQRFGDRWGGTYVIADYVTRPGTFRTR